MSESRLRWIALIAFGAVLALALRHMASPGAAEASRPAGGDEVALTIPVEIVEVGQSPRRLEVKIPAAVEIPAPLR